MVFLSAFVAKQEFIPLWAVRITKPWSGFSKGRVSLFYQARIYCTLIDDVWNLSFMKGGRYLFAQGCYFLFSFSLKNKTAGLPRKYTERMMFGQTYSWSHQIITGLIVKITVPLQNPKAVIWIFWLCQRAAVKRQAIPIRNKVAENTILSLLPFHAKISVCGNITIQNTKIMNKKFLMRFRQSAFCSVFNDHPHHRTLFKGILWQQTKWVKHKILEPFVTNSHIC